MRWLIYQQASKRFPYLLLIEHEAGKFLSYAVQDKWPGPGKNIFCIPGQELTEDQLPKELELLDSCDIKKLARYGRKLVIILDRKVKKRSWFLTVEKQSRTNQVRLTSKLSGSPRHQQLPTAAVLTFPKPVSGAI
ncbi:MAG: hypothetical protein ABIK67_00680 [candidate division WOR-3 bacterium]